LFHLKKHKLDKSKIIAIAETSNFGEFKKFMLDEENTEERQWVWDRYEGQSEYRCIKDCEKCIAADNFYFKSCIQHLYHYAKFNLADNVVLPREELGVVKIFDSGIDKLQCDFCYVSRRCPKYQIGANCAFDFNPVDADNPKILMERVIGIQAERVVRGHFFEKVDGGAIDKNLSSEMGLLGSLVKLKGDIEKPRARISFKAEGEGKEGTDVVGQMLKSMFGPKENKNEVEKIDDAEVVDDGGN